MILLETKVNFRLDVPGGYQYNNCVFKEREAKVSKYRDRI
jgi:hypothetical protein